MGDRFVLAHQLEDRRLGRARLRRHLLVSVVMLSLGGFASARQATDPRVLGDLFGHRARLEERGLSFQLFYNHEAGWKPRGGRNRGNAFEQSGSVDLFVRADLGRMQWVPEAELFVQVKNNWGRNVNPDVGALSDPIDDADFNELAYVDQLYYEQNLSAGAVRFRVGYLDQQTILDRNAYANSEDKQFLSTFLDNNNAIVPLKIGFGATVWLQPLPWLGCILGVADAENDIREAGFRTAFDDFHSLMEYFELDLHSELEGPAGPLPGNLRVGVFYDPRTNVEFGRTDPSSSAPRTDKGHAGTWLSLDQLLYREGSEDLQGLGFFARYGYRDADVQRITRTCSAGLQYRGLLPGREQDLAGLGMYRAVASAPYRRAIDPGFRRETGVEAYYSVQVAPWLTVALDAQFIEDPGARNSSRDALVFGLRVRAAF